MSKTDDTTNLEAAPAAPEGMISTEAPVISQALLNDRCPDCRHPLADHDASGCLLVINAELELSCECVMDGPKTLADLNAVVAIPEGEGGGAGDA